MSARRAARISPAVGRGLGCWRHRLPHRQPESRSLRHWTNARSAPSLPCGEAVDGSTLTEARPPRRTRQHAASTSGAGSASRERAIMNGVTQPTIPTASLGLDDLVILVTGGASGIGRVTAGYLVGAGARVVLVDTDAAMLEAAIEELAASDRVTVGRRRHHRRGTDGRGGDRCGRTVRTSRRPRVVRRHPPDLGAGTRRVVGGVVEGPRREPARHAGRRPRRRPGDGRPGRRRDRHGRLGGRSHPPHRPGGLRRQQGGSHPGHPCAGPRVRPRIRSV